MRTAVLLSILTVALFGGCAESYSPHAGEGPGSAAESRAHVVLAIVDNGILPYHAEFRDNSSEAFTHPSAYISGYPSDVQPLRLSFGGNLSENLKHDAPEWSAVRPGQLYWIPGTRIIGLIVVDSNITKPWSDQHGTMAASRAAGMASGLAPEAKIVLVLGIGAHGVTWAAEQPWIDIQSNSWGEQVPDPGGRAVPAGRDSHDALAEAAKNQIVVVAAGNGQPPHSATGGILGTPTPLEGTVPPGVVSVGAEDNGYVTPWSNVQPDVVADGCLSVSADPSDLGKVGPNAEGTSAAAPYVAGVFASVLLKGRELVGDHGVHHDQGIFAHGKPIDTSSLLADGNLRIEEIKQLVFETASLAPQPDPHDGEKCPDVPVSPGSPYTSAVPISNLEPPLSFYWVGYGVENYKTLALAKDVLSGAAPMPARAEEDRLHDTQDALRS